MAKPVRILILGTGGMANNHAQKFAEIEGVTLVGGIDTRPEQLADFCARHHIAKGFASIDEAIAWGEFDAVTNVTPVFFILQRHGRGLDACVFVQRRGNRAMHKQGVDFLDDLVFVFVDVLAPNGDADAHGNLLRK